MNDKIEQLEQQILEIDEEINRLLSRYANISTEAVVKADVTHVYDTDLGMNIAVDNGAKRVINPGEAEQRRIMASVSGLNARRTRLQNELDMLRGKRASDEEKMQIEIENSQKSERKHDELLKRRIEHEKDHKYLNILVECLTLAGMKDLARVLSDVRFSNYQMSLFSVHPYVQEEIDLRIDEAVSKNSVTTKKEMDEIRRSVKRLPKKATMLLKKYSGLSNLYLAAQRIVYDMKKKGLLDIENVGERKQALTDYFKNPTSEYYIDDNGLTESKNLGYEYLAFYRDLDSDYRNDYRRGRI